MSKTETIGWHRLLADFPWFRGEDSYPLPAYSEYMPPPRLGKRPYGEGDPHLFAEDDPFGWHITEMEELLELQPGLESVARQILDELVELGQGEPAYRIAGRQRRNLVDNPYWPQDLAAAAGHLPHEKYVFLSPLALSRTQDDKARVRWTYFGGSEQGPERAFWQGFYSAPDTELPADQAASFLARLLQAAYGVKARTVADLRAAGLRVFPSDPDPRFPYWHVASLPSWTQPLLWRPADGLDEVRFLLTFRPFAGLPPPVKSAYFEGRLMLLPFPGSLVFWGIPAYAKLQQELPMAMQVPLQRMAARHGAADGLKVPQSGWFAESGSDFNAAEVQEKLLLNTYRRTNRWDRVSRYDDELVLSTIENTLAQVLFGTSLDDMGLYGKPMARNSQLWTADSRLVLDGPNASRAELEQAALTVARGGLFRYRFQFPAMRVGRYEVYWQRPLAAFWNEAAQAVEMISSPPLGYLTAYDPAQPDLAHPVELWPRVLQREPWLWALRNFRHLGPQEKYANQTALNILRLLDTWRRFGQAPLPRSLARQVLRLSERDPLETWLESLPAKSENPAEGKELYSFLLACLEPSTSDKPFTSLPGTPVPENLPGSLTFDRTATRDFEIAWWEDIRRLSTGIYVNKDNADCISDKATLSHLTHCTRDLERIGDYLLERYDETIRAAGMEEQAVCGELPFHWNTDFDFSVFGGWKLNQEGHTYERDLVLIIPGKNRHEAVIMADHYDTAYMEDVYEKGRGGDGARLSAAGADDNYSATSTLLQAAPIFLQMAQEGKLERDVWLVNLTGEEFPSDCMGARHLAQALVQGTLQMRTRAGEMRDLSHVRVVGAYIMDMIGHNRENDLDDFQISPGLGRGSLELAHQAHIANLIWNVEAKKWNSSPERRGKGRGKRIAGEQEIPAVAEHLRLQGEVRLPEDPLSSLFNTDGQIFSDSGIPVVLLMENYDINRKGYHDRLDTLENIDLDYGAAVAAIAIEAAARVATAA